MTLGYSHVFKDGTPTRFKEKILLGEKTHSIRADIHNRWRAGMAIHHVYYNRTVNRYEFLRNTCVSTQRILIKHTALIATDALGEENVAGRGVMVMVDGRVLCKERVELLAHKDGFECIEAFYTWFNKDFAGTIIHWTKMRY